MWQAFDFAFARQARWNMVFRLVSWRENAGIERESLLRLGARLKLPDDPPWATRRGHQQIVELLKRHEQTGVLPVQSVAV
jgi:hypothetical protein